MFIAPSGASKADSLYRTAMCFSSVSTIKGVMRTCSDVSRCVWSWDENGSEVRMSSSESIGTTGK